MCETRDTICPAHRQTEEDSLITLNRNAKPENGKLSPIARKKARNVSLGKVSGIGLLEQICSHLIAPGLFQAALKLADEN